jgi:hypothetical protein
MKMGKIVRKEDHYDKAIKIETRIKSNLIKNKHEWEDASIYTPSNESRIKQTMSSPHFNNTSQLNSFKTNASINERLRNDSKRKPDMLIQDSSISHKRKNYNDYFSESENFDYKSISDKQKQEINELMERDRNNKVEIEYLKRQLDEMAKKQFGKNSYEFEMKQTDRNNNISDLKNHYEKLLTNKDKEIQNLNLAFTAVESERDCCSDKITEFIKRISKSILNETLQCDKINPIEMDKFLSNIESLLIKLINENNQFRAQPERDFDNGKITMLNKMLNELKEENDTLK